MDQENEKLQQDTDAQSVTQAQESAVSDEIRATETVETAISSTENIDEGTIPLTEPAAETAPQDSADDEDSDEPQKPKTFKEQIAFKVYDLASVFGTAVIAIMVVFTFFFRFVGVVGPSMQPTLYENDWLAVSAIPREPKAGDIVIITQENKFGEPIVKRVIATEGQTVDIRNGHVYIDSDTEPLVENYISPDIITIREDLDNYPLTVPEGQVFVLGDNRMHSSDSRSSMIGLIDADYILGTVSFRVMPFGKWKVGEKYDYSRYSDAAGSDSSMVSWAYGADASADS